VSAFAHKAGLHASAIKVAPNLYQHIDPEEVGNTMRMLVSDMAGRASVELKGKELGYDLADDRALVTRVVAEVKKREQAGYTYESADASFELLLRSEIEGIDERCFRLGSWRTVIERRPDGSELNRVIVQLTVDGELVVATGEGTGPVDAMDRALRMALRGAYPWLEEIQMVDYKARLLDGPVGAATSARVLTTFRGYGTEWITIGVGPSVIAASYQAIDDAFTYPFVKFESLRLGRLTNRRSA
jgi:2-isopropylmalate synthase